MCRNCLRRCNCQDACYDRRCHGCGVFDNRCDDFIWPILFWMMRDMTRNCRCTFVNRYDRYRY